MIDIVIMLLYTVSQVLSPVVCFTGRYAHSPASISIIWLGTRNVAPTRLS